MAVVKFTKGHEEKLIIEFAIPIILGNIFMQLYNYTDSVIVGRYIGKEALAAVGASSPYIFLLVSLVIGISIGSSIMVSRSYGKGDTASIKKIADTLYIFLFFSSIVLTILGILFNRQIMSLIGLPENIMPYALDYLNIYLIGIVFLFIFNSLSSILRGMGDSKTPLIFLIASSVFNIVLDLLFVIVFDWGIKGVAWATVIAQFFAVFFAIVYTNKHNKVAYVSIRSMSFDKKVFAESIKLGIPAGLQQMFVSIGMLAIVSVVNGFGTDTIAAYSAAGRIESFVMVIPMTLSIAVTNFTSQNLGAGEFQRIKNGVVATMKINIIASVLIMILLSALSLPLMKMFTEDKIVIETGCTYLFILGLSYWIFGTMFTYMGAIRGIGNTIIPMFISLLSLWLIRVPTAKILSVPLGEIGIWISAPMSWFIGALSSYIFYKKEIKKVSMLDKRRDEPIESDKVDIF